MNTSQNLDILSNRGWHRRVAGDENVTFVIGLLIVCWLSLQTKC